MNTQNKVQDFKKYHVIVKFITGQWLGNVSYLSIDSKVFQIHLQNLQNENCNILQISGITKTSIARGFRKHKIVTSLKAPMRDKTLVSLLMWFTNSAGTGELKNTNALNKMQR